MSDPQEGSDRSPTQNDVQHQNGFEFLFGTGIDQNLEQIDTGNEENNDQPTHWYIARIGQLGMYMAVLAVVLAVGGLTLGWFNIQPYTNIAIIFSLVIATIALLIATVVQVYQSGFTGISP